MKAGLQLMALAVATTVIITLVSALTKDAIETSNQRMLSASLAEIVPDSMHDSRWIDNRYTFQHAALGSDESLTIYPIIKHGVWNGVALTAIAPDGYTGEIRLLVAIDNNDHLLGVRVLQHRETPGLGDGIERRKSDWITDFDDRSLSTLAPSLWTVKKDGGAFDQFTGATITPRVVVRTVHRVLDWYTRKGEQLLQQQFQRHLQNQWQLDTQPQ